MSTLTPREHALRVAVLRTLLDVVESEYEAARDAAEPEFAGMRAEGQKQQAVMLPDGTEIGLISIKGGSPTVAMKEADLEAWVREHVPDGMEDYVVPGALANLEVLDMLKACFPETVKQRVRSATRTALLKEIIDSGGKVADKESGEVAELGKVEPHKPTGAFSYRSAKGAHERIVTEWRAGNLAEIAFGPLALPEAAGSSGPDAPSAPETPRPGALYADDHGFVSPEMAAAHAVMVQGGFSTPPIEAYRMIRDGGVAADRALAWLAEHGLDPADPREGRDTPWPLPAASDAEAGQ